MNIPDALIHLWAFLWPIASTVVAIGGSIWGVREVWPFIRRTFAVTDIVAQLPEQMARLEQSDARKLDLISEVKSTLDKHIADTRAGVQEWGEMRDTLKYLVATAEDVKHEVKHNGGTSIKDAVARIESAVTNPESAYVTGNLLLGQSRTTTNSRTTTTTTEGSKSD